MKLIINTKNMNEARFEEIFAAMEELEEELEKEMNEQKEAEEIEAFGIEALNEIRSRSLQPKQTK